MKHLSACTLDCQDACATVVKVHPRTGKVTITGNPDHPFTRGLICKKGGRAHQRNTSPARITTPLLKKRTTFEPVSWNMALDLAAEHLKALKHRPASILHIRHYGYRGALSGAGRYLFNALGASTTRGALCDEAGCTAFIQDFGALEMNDPMDLLNAGHIVNWGKDLSRSSIHLARLVKEARQKKIGVTTISPGRDGNAPYSDHVIRIRPGRDRFLAAAVIQVILSKGLDHPATLNRAFNLPALEAAVFSIPMAELLDACQCTRDDVDHLVRIFTGDTVSNPNPSASTIKQVPADPAGSPDTPVRPPVALLMGWGIQRYHHGGETTRFLNALAFISGHIGRSGGGTYFNISSGRNLDNRWENQLGKPARHLLLPRIGREILAADPPIRFLLADGSNFVNQAPDAGVTIQAMAAIDFKVVIDAFMTDTAVRADLILPCALDNEREEVLGSCLHNWVNYSRPIFPPRGSARSDFDIMADLATRLNIPFPDKTTILETALSTPPLQDAGAGLDMLKARGSIQARHPKIAWKDRVFAHPDGRYRFPETLSPPRPKPDAFPMNLLTLVNRDAMHSQITDNAAEKAGHTLPRLWIHPEAPHLKTIDPEAPVDLVTPLGRMRVRLCLAPDLHPRALVMRRGGWLAHHHCANHLIQPDITDIGETAAYYSQCARLENPEPDPQNS